MIRGLEADLSYYFDAEKIRAARDALKRKSMDPADYPRPDLAIEIDVSGPKVDRASIYAVLGVVEVWRFDGANVVIAAGDDDRLVVLPDLVALRDAWPGSTLLRVPQAHFGYRMMSEAVEWLTQRGLLRRVDIAPAK